MPDKSERMKAPTYMQISEAPGAVETVFISGLKAPSYGTARAPYNVTDLSIYPYTLHLSDTSVEPVLSNTGSTPSSCMACTSTQML